MFDVSNGRIFSALAQFRAVQFLSEVLCLQFLSQVWETPLLPADGKAVLRMEQRPSKDETTGDSRYSGLVHRSPDGIIRLLFFLRSDFPYVHPQIGLAIRRQAPCCLTFRMAASSLRYPNLSRCNFDPISSDFSSYPKYWRARCCFAADGGRHILPPDSRKWSRIWRFVAIDRMFRYTPFKGTSIRSTKLPVAQSKRATAAKVSCCSLSRNIDEVIVLFHSNFLRLSQLALVLICSVSLVPVCAGHAPPVNTSSIQGIVLTEAGEPLPNARVDISTAVPVQGPALFCPSCYSALPEVDDY